MLEYHLQSLQIVRERAKGGRIRTAQVQRGEKSTSLCRCVEHAPLWALWFLFLNKLLSQKKGAFRVLRCVYVTFVTLECVRARVWLLPSLRSVGACVWPWVFFETKRTNFIREGLPKGGHSSTHTRGVP